MDDEIEFEFKKAVRVVFSGGAELQLTGMSDAEVAELTEYLTTGRRYVRREPYAIGPTVVLPALVAYFVVEHDDYKSWY
jgi:hypothetical protein